MANAPHQPRHILTALSISSYMMAMDPGSITDHPNGGQGVDGNTQFVPAYLCEF